MSAEVREQILRMIEGSQSRPSAVEFEMAYQARVAIDRIRFAIKHIEQFGPSMDQTREACVQLLDALERLEIVDRRFQTRSRIRESRSIAAVAGLAVNGEREKRARDHE
jgi:hypothetical protein